MKTCPNTLYVLVGASGVGKGELMKHVFAALPDLHHVRSWTSRKRRPGESKTAYHFVWEFIFRIMIWFGFFLEWAQPFLNDPKNPRPDFYGRTKGSFEPLREGNCLCDMTEHGVAALQELADQGMFSLVVIRIIGANMQGLERTAERAASDAERARIPIRVHYEITNDHEPGGLGRATQELLMILQGCPLDATRVASP